MISILRILSRGNVAGGIALLPAGFRKNRFPFGWENRKTYNRRGKLNHEKLSAGKIISLSLMLFAMFFGAGNMIFPPMLGHLSGYKFFEGTLGFVVSDAGLSVLGIAAIVLVGSKLDDLGKLIGPRFAIFMGALIYLLIGPFFAMPRTGTVAYEMAVIPFTHGEGGIWASLAFTGSLLSGLDLCAVPQSE